MSRALMLHVATLLASWRQGARVTVIEAVPVWLDPDAELVAALVDARLLDKSGRIPPRSWKGWFGPAWDRREVRRESGRKGGQASGKRRLSVAEPDRPSGRSVSTVRQDRSSRAGAREAPSNNGATSDAAAAAREVVAGLHLAGKR
jgi:general stress protein YciG